MRVKLSLVLCSDDGQEETVTDVVTLQKDSCGQKTHAASRASSLRPVVRFLTRRLRLAACIATA